MDNFVCQSNQKGIKYFFFEFFDEKWKDDIYGGVEGHWGLFYQKCVPRNPPSANADLFSTVKPSRASPSPIARLLNDGITRSLHLDSLFLPPLTAGSTYSCTHRSPVCCHEPFPFFLYASRPPRTFCVYSPISVRSRIHFFIVLVTTAFHPLPLSDLIAT